MRNGKLMTTRVAAIAMSSMMVLSPLTAFANAPASNAPQQGPVYGTSIQDEIKVGTDENGNIVYGEEGTATYFLDGKKSDGKNITSASFKKTIALQDIKNTDYIPSVPDIQYNYELVPVSKDALAAISGDSENDSYNGATIFATADDEKLKSAVTLNDTKIVFTHNDIADGDEAKGGVGEGHDDKAKDTMTRLGVINIDATAFTGKDAGVYRYILTETGYEDISGRTGAAAVKDDINPIGDPYQSRIVDVVIQRVSANPKSTERRVVGVVLLEAERTYADGKWQVTSVDKKKKVEGYTPYSYDGNEDAFSKYTTWDLLIDKEVTGQGLTQEDAEKAYTFDITINGPAGAVIQVFKAAAGLASEKNDAKLGDKWIIGDDGTYKTAISFHNNEWIEVSGLPSGATYTIKEQEASTAGMKVHTVLNADNKPFNVKREDGTTAEGVLTITMDADKKLAEAVDHDAVLNKAKEDGNQLVNGKENQEIFKLNQVWTKKDANWTTADDKTNHLKGEVDVQNLLIVNEKPPITVTGVVMNVAPYALMVIAAAIFAGLFISKKRQEEEI